MLNRLKNIKFKLTLHIILVCFVLPCLAQPTGHQKIFLEIIDNDDTLDFKTSFKENEIERKLSIKYKNYQLIDIGYNKTGFQLYPRSEYIHKTLMTKNHEILIVKNKIDTMSIQILNAFNIYFLSIHFQKGNFRIAVNDGPENKWAINTLPFKRIREEQIVYNISPKDWSAFEVNDAKTIADYSVQIQFKKQGLLVNPVLPEDDPNFKNPRRINYLRIELGDFNFDGNKDYREHKLNQPDEWNYFIYKDSILGFVFDTLLSQLNIVKFNDDNKTFVVQSDQSSSKKLTTYFFDNGKATIFNDKSQPISKSNEDPKYREKILDTSKHIYSVQPFQFTLERNYSEVQLPDIEGFYANKISVYNDKTKALIFSTITLSNYLKETPGCSDTLQISDFNFDGFPDFRICNYSVQGKHTYYIYHPLKQTFIIEKNLSVLINLSFDFQNKIANGYSVKKKVEPKSMFPAQQFYTEQLCFEGIGLQNLTITTVKEPNNLVSNSKCQYINQKRIYEGDTIGLKLLNKKPLLRKVNQFEFKLIFNPEESKPYDEKGAYVRHLIIFYKDKEFGPYEFHGNYFREINYWQDSLEIADFNFDGYPDIRFYNSLENNGTYYYLIFNPTYGIEQFYIESLFSGLLESEFNPKFKILKGRIEEPSQTIYFYLKNDTLTLSKQDHDLNKPPFIEESIYKYGERKIIRSAYNQLEVNRKMEFGDYNFDGFNDFRQQSDISPYFWDVFIYNPQKNAYEKDNFLSTMAGFEYNQLNKSLLCYSRKKLGETTWETRYYKWSFVDQKMIFYKEILCYSKSPNSESNQCYIKELINGKWLEMVHFGAE